MVTRVAATWIWSRHRHAVSEMMRQHMGRRLRASNSTSALEVRDSSNKKSVGLGLFMRSQLQLHLRVNGEQVCTLVATSPV